MPEKEKIFIISLHPSVLRESCSNNQIQEGAAMAIVELHPFIRTIRKSLEGLVFSSRKGAAYVRGKGRYRNPRTAIQQANRSAFASLVREWGRLGDGERALWNAGARETRISGYNAFISENMARVRAGIVIDRVPATPDCIRREPSHAAVHSGGMPGGALLLQ
jgi:hypothetical protein